MLPENHCPTESSPTNFLAFKSTTWQANVARAGSAVDLSVWYHVTTGGITTTNFTNCTFRQNNGYYTSKLNTAVGIGALYVDSISPYWIKQV